MSSSAVRTQPIDALSSGRLGGAAPGVQGHNMDHLCFRLKNFDPVAISRHLSDAGFAPDEVVYRYGAQGQGPSIYVKDPEQNMVELKGAIER